MDKVGLCNRGLHSDPNWKDNGANLETYEWFNTTLEATSWSKQLRWEIMLSLCVLVKHHIIKPFNYSSVFIQLCIRRIMKAQRINRLSLPSFSLSQESHFYYSLFSKNSIFTFTCDRALLTLVHIVHSHPVDESIEQIKVIQKSERKSI